MAEVLANNGDNVVICLAPAAHPTAHFFFFFFFLQEHRFHDIHPPSKGKSLKMSTLSNTTVWFLRTETGLMSETNLLKFQVVHEACRLRANFWKKNLKNRVSGPKKRTSNSRASGGEKTVFCGISEPIPRCGGAYSGKWTKF